MPSSGHPNVKIANLRLVRKKHAIGRKKCTQALLSVNELVNFAKVHDDRAKMCFYYIIPNLNTLSLMTKVKKWFGLKPSH